MYRDGLLEENVLVDWMGSNYYILQINYPTILSGNFYIEMITHNPCATDSSVLSNTVNIFKQAPYTYCPSAPSGLCASTSVKFLIMDVNAYHVTYPGTTYQWRRNGEILTGQTETEFTATTSGQYDLDWIDPCGAHGTVRVIDMLLINCSPLDAVISGPTNIISGQLNTSYSVPAQSGVSYFWSVIGGTIVNGQGTNTVTVDWNGNNTGQTNNSSYSIFLSETDLAKETKTTSLTTHSSTATSISKSLTQSGITLFPNPTTESFNIEMPESGLAVSYEILDLTGAPVAKGNFVSTGIAEKIAANFGAGMYQVVLRYNNIITTGRLSKVQ